MDDALRPMLGSLLSLHLSAWIGAPPSLREDPTILAALVADLVELLQPYAVRSIWTDEPRTYGLGAHAQTQLLGAFAARRLTSFALESAPGEAKEATATSFVDLGLSGRPGMTVNVGVRLDIRPGAALPMIVPPLSDFVVRWLGRLPAAAAYLSDRWDEDFGHTLHEQPGRRGAIATWAGIRRYARGVFWGTGLGPALCAHLGGQGRVLTEAPVALARPAGPGVWLQVAALPPASEEALDRLAGYLRPLLDWSRGDLEAVEAEERLTANRLSSSPSTPSPSTARPLGAAASPAAAGPRRQRAGIRRRLIPLRVLDDRGTSIGLNVHLAMLRPPGQAAVANAVSAWYGDGFAGAFGGEGFHDIIGPSVDVEGQAMRWFVDLGSANPRRAIRELRERLSALPDVDIARLVVGTEDAS